MSEDDGLLRMDFRAPITPRELAAIKRELKAAREEIEIMRAARGVCKWTYDHSEGFYETDCGQSWRFEDGGVADNGVKFCHGCGKVVEVRV